MKTRIPVLVVALALIQQTAAAAPSDNCPATSGFSVTTPGPIGAEVCFGTSDYAGYIGPVRWNGDDDVDLLLGVVGGYGGMSYTLQNVEVWAGGSGWGPGTQPDIAVDNSIWGVDDNTVITSVWGDTDGNGRDEVVYMRASWVSNYCNDGMATLYEVSGGRASWGVGMQPSSYDGGFGLGDLNGDRYDDRAGELEVVLGGPSGAWSASATVIPTVQQAIGPAGDVNGDGYADVLLADPAGAGTELYWAPGNGSGLGPIESLAPSGDVTAVGDIDGDGFSDLLLHGISGSPPTVLLGSAAGPSWSSAQLPFGSVPTSVERATTGDVNGDGFDDLLVEATLWPDGAPAFGSHLFLGTAAGLSPGPSWTGGFSARLIGDLDGDGLADLIAEGGSAQYGGLGVWMLPGQPCPDDLDCDGTLDGDDCSPYSGVAWDGAPEVCDGWDNDCDGDVDEGFDQDGDGWSTCAGDCDDGNAAVRPDAVEQCNGVDDTCDGRVDWTSGLTPHDPDDDGAIGVCDCDHTDPSINPGADELCFTGIDEDCDGVVDEADCVDAESEPPSVEDEPPGDEDPQGEDGDAGGPDVPPAPDEGEARDEEASTVGCEDGSESVAGLALLLGVPALRRRGRWAF